MPRDFAKNPAHTYLPADVLAAVDADAERRGLSRAAVIRERLVLDFVRRTTSESNVPERLEDPAAVEQIGAALRRDLG